MAHGRDEALADLADLILNVGRLVRSRTPSGADVVTLTETERHVMRLVDLHPGCSPSELATWARLQRTNVSTALRTLESKGLVARDSARGRGVSVSPTPLAAANLGRLRAAWAQQLAEVIPDDGAALESCVALLDQVEQGLLGHPPTSS